MIDINNILKLNKEEAIKILSKAKNNTFVFAQWDGDCYSNADDCPYILYMNDDGDINTELVVAAKYDERKNGILLLTTNDEFEPVIDEEKNWIPMVYCYEISYWSVLDAIGNEYWQAKNGVGYGSK